MPRYDRRFSRAQLRSRRRALGLNLEEIARAVFRSPSTVRAYELGCVIPPTDALPLLAEILECSIDDLFDEISETATGAA